MRIRAPLRELRPFTPKGYYVQTVKRMYVRDEGKFVAVGWRVHYWKSYDAPAKLPSFTVKAILDRDIEFEN